MKVIEKIQHCERNYAACFSEVVEQDGLIKFRDDSIPDMYSHNFIWIKDVVDDSVFNRFMESEVVGRKKEARDFCLIRCDAPVNESNLTSVSYKYELSTLGCYVFDISRFLEISKTVECSVLKVDKPEMINEILRLDLEAEGDILGVDFCTRRVDRRKDVYLSDGGVDSFLCYSDGVAIGNCEMFVFEDTAKIENFSISSKAQRKGFGNALLTNLIKSAMHRGVSLIYLNTDEDETAKEMYKKLGFNKMYEYTEILFKF